MLRLFAVPRTVHLAALDALSPLIRLLFDLGALGRRLLFDLARLVRSRKQQQRGRHQQVAAVLAPTAAFEHVSILI